MSPVARIDELLRAGQTFSFEFFPPKTDEEHLALVKTLFELQPLEPSFVSVTYRGGPSSRRRTVDLVSGMLRTTTLTPMAHLICVGHTRLELAEILVELRKAGVENLMALGGDRPDGEEADSSDLALAVELVELARAIGGFSIGVAAHPAGHPRAPSLNEDRDRLAEKMERADFAITQFFFEADEYFSLVADLTARGIQKPVIPGIMPVTSLSSLKRMAQMGAPVPAWMATRLESAAAGAGEAGADLAVREEGTALAARLCRQLIDQGAPGLHFYTLNRSGVTRRIYDELRIGT
jgi:methylenetetrahydrofolate reductase (NADPH)